MSILIFLFVFAGSNQMHVFTKTMPTNECREHVKKMDGKMKTDGRWAKSYRLAVFVCVPAKDGVAL